MEKKAKDDKTPRITKTVTNNFNAPIMHYYEYVENNYANGSPDKGEMQESFEGLPTAEQMKQAVLATMKQGYWGSSRGWAVVYRVYQMKGYCKSYAQFAREVEEWGIETTFLCNYDAIQKPIATGMLSGLPEKWEAQGAQGQLVKLANALINELNGLM